MKETDAMHLFFLDCFSSYAYKEHLNRLELLWKHLSTSDLSSFLDERNRVSDVDSGVCIGNALVVLGHEIGTYY